MRPNFKNTLEIYNFWNWSATLTALCESHLRKHTTNFRTFGIGEQPLRHFVGPTFKNIREIMSLQSVSTPCPAARPAAGHGVLARKMQKPHWRPLWTSRFNFPGEKKTRALPPGGSIITRTPAMNVRISHLPPLPSRPCPAPPMFLFHVRLLEGPF